MTSEFVHLHNHSDYSLLDGAQRVDQLVNTVCILNGLGEFFEQLKHFVLTFKIKLRCGISKTVGIISFLPCPLADVNIMSFPVIFLSIMSIISTY